MKRIVSMIAALVLALSLCLPVLAEESPNTGEVQKYGNIGRLSKLNITEDELNDVLKDIMVNSICNRYVFFNTMTDMLMALNRGDIVVLETDQNTVRYIASRNDNIVDRPPYLNPNNLMFSILLRGEDTELRDQISDCITKMKEDGTLDEMKQRYIEDVIADLGEPAEAVEYRLNLKAVDFASYADGVLEALQEKIGSGSVPGMTLEQPNYEGVRVNCVDGWFLIRKSLHDPLMPLNIESDVPGGAAKIAAQVKGLLEPFDQLDLSKLA